MNSRSAFPILAIAALLLCSCSTLFRSVVTTTEVVSDAITAWADLSVAGKTTPPLDARVRLAHGEYQKACAVARDALKAYRDTGDKTKYEQALAAVSVAMNGVLDIVLPLLTPDQSVTLKAKAVKAKGIK